MVSIKESNPSKNKSESRCWILGDNNSQKPARTRATFRGNELLACLHYLRQKPALPRTVALDHRFLVIGRDRHAIHLNNVSVVSQRFAWIINSKIIQRDQVSVLLKPLACSNYQIIGLNGLQHFHNRLLRRKQADIIFEENLARTVQESAAPSAERFQPHEHGGVERVARCGIRIRGAEIILYTITK